MQIGAEYAESHNQPALHSEKWIADVEDGTEVVRIGDRNTKDCELCTNKVVPTDSKNLCPEDNAEKS